MLCPTEDELVALVERMLCADDRAHAVEHLDECRACRVLVAELARDDGPAPLLRGSEVGRYLVLEWEGAGAMGNVYSAFDPELDRKVALKMVRPERIGEEPGLADRLLAEARALARVSHPNVVTVYDAGARGEEVFLAMEWVTGTTLSAWLDRPRSRGDVLAVFRQAGEGIAAAHRAGIVHRDLKPDNVLVGADGRVRVMDFGLALAESRAAQLAAGGPIGVTRGLAGTPAYMAPEQLEGRPATVRSDVFSFSVMLWEALEGRRPFEGNHPEALLTEISSGRIVAPRRTPSRLVNLLQRGLALRPEDRWPGIVELLQALERAERSRWIAPATLLAVGVTAGLVIATDSPTCTPSSLLDATFPAARAASLKEAFLNADATLGPETFTALSRTLSTYARRFDAAALDACEATHVRREQSAGMLDLAAACLDARRARVEALLRALAASPVLERAVSLAQQLPGPEDCRRRDALAERVPPPPGTEARAKELEARSAAFMTAALLDEAVSPAAWEEIFAESEALGSASLGARVRVARLPSLLQYPAQSEQWATEAAALAFEARDDEAAADAWTWLVDTAAREGRVPLAELAARQARAAIRRLGDDPVREADVRVHLCRVYERAGRFDDARNTCETALPLLASGDVRRGAVEDLLGNLAYWEARYLDALEHYQRAESLRSAVLGAAHPAVDNSLGNQAEVMIALGRVEEGIALYRALLVRHPTFIHLLDGLGAGLRKKGDFEGALAVDGEANRRCIETGRQACQIWTSISLSEDLLELRRFQEARDVLDAVRSIDAEVQPLDRVRLESASARAWTELDPARALRDLRVAIEALTPLAERHGRAHAERLQGLKALERHLSRLDLPR